MKDYYEPRNPKKQAKRIEKLTKRLTYILVQLYIPSLQVERARYDHNDVQYASVEI